LLATAGGRLPFGRADAVAQAATLEAVRAAATRMDAPVVATG
jgi:hypothetical protein